MIKIKRFIALALAALILASLFMTHVVATPSYREFDDPDHGIDDFLTEHQLNICQKNVGQFLEDHDLCRRPGTGALYGGADLDADLRYFFADLYHFSYSADRWPGISIESLEGHQGSCS